jgi:hypothetical protein
MISDDATNPFLSNENAPALLSGAIHDLIGTASLVVTSDPALTTAFTNSALSNLTTLTEEADVTSALRGVLFEVSRYIHHHVDSSVPVTEGEVPESHQEVLKRDPRSMIVTTAAREWFKLTCAQNDEGAVNVLKAIHKELPLPMIPQAYLYVATVAVCSLSVSVHMQYFGGEEDSSTPAQ